MPRVYEIAGDVIKGCNCSMHHNAADSNADLTQCTTTTGARNDKSFASASQQPSYAPSLDLAPIHNELHIDIDFAHARVTNRVVVTFHDARPVTSAVEAAEKSAGVCVSPADPFSGVPTVDNIEVPGKNSIQLNAVGFSNVSVRSVAAPASAYAHIEQLTEKDSDVSSESKISTSVSVRHEYDGKLISLEWNRPFRPNETRSVEISYVVENPATGLVFGPKQNPSWVISDHETERAQYWLPCVDLPSVRTALDFFITAPSDKTILANGLLISETSSVSNGENRKTAHWRLDSAVCPSYLLCIAIGNFVEFDHGEFVDELATPSTSGVEPKKIKYFGVPLKHGEGCTSKQLAQSFRETPAMLKWLSQLLQVPYPFPKYYQFIVQGVGGAMENISLVSWDEVFLLDEKLALEFQTYTDMVNIHEMGHSYFGDAVVCRHFDHAWLKEGWATYCEYLWLFDHKGADTALWYMTREGDSYMDENRGSYNRSIVTNVYDHSWNMYDMHLYPGGAWRLHMLMHKLGRVAFFRGVNLYLRENQGKVVETDTFRHCLERASGGQNLTEFFQQWIYGYGFPEIKAQRKYVDGTLTVDLKQTQKFAENGTRTGHAFAITLEVYAEVEQGQWRLQNAVFDSAGSATVAFTQLSHAPLQVLIDPYQKVLHRLTFDAGFDSLVRTLNSITPAASSPAAAAGTASTANALGASSGGHHVPSVNVSGIQRGRAASVLVSNYGVAGIRAVAQALLEEPFWGTRVTIASALASSPFREAQIALAGLVASEKEHDAIQYVLHYAISAQKSEVLATALRLRYQVQSGNDLGYRAQRNLLLALANHGGIQDLPIIASAILRPQYQGIVQAGAINALRTVAIKALDTLLPPVDASDSLSLASAEETKQVQQPSNISEYAAFAKLIVTLNALVRSPPTLSSNPASTSVTGVAGASPAAQLDAVLQQLSNNLPSSSPQLGSKAAVAIRVAAATSLGAISAALKNANGYDPLRKKIETLLIGYVSEHDFQDTNRALFTTSVEMLARQAGSSRSVGLLNSLRAKVDSQHQGWLKKQTESLAKLTASTTPAIDGELAKLNERLSAIEKKAAATADAGGNDKKSGDASGSSEKSSKRRHTDSEKQLITAGICLLAAGLGFFLGRRK